MKLSHVQITPEVAVFDRNRQLIYDGRIDDWYIDLSRRAPCADDARTGRCDPRGARRASPWPSNEVRGVGCYISDLE